jgi:undecaprenyl-diphosphatase
LIAIDLEVLYFFNSFAQRWPEFDLFVRALSKINLFKGAVFVTLIWSLWFSQKQTRISLIVTVIGSIATMAITRTLALTLPFRSRPRHDETLNFFLPHGSKLAEMQGNSSFPSDHAALFFALSTGLFLANKKAGMFAYLYTLILICIPRIYLGLHFLSDIIMGALIGIAMILLFQLIEKKKKYAEHLLIVEEKYSGIFYSMFFLLSYQMATMFEESRTIARLLLSIF